MKHASYLFYTLLWLFALALLSCEKEENECLLFEHYVVIRSFDADNNDITGTGAVKEVVLYVFDKNGYYLECINGVENQRIQLLYKENSPITVIVWGNSAGGRQKMPELSAGKSRLEDAFVSVLAGSGAHVVSPDELFFGQSVIDLSAVSDWKGLEHRVAIHRKIASMNIVVKGLREFFETTDTDFYFVVNGIRQLIDFKGLFAGSAVSQKPLVQLNQTGYFVSNIFNAFPSSETGVTIDIYKGNTKVYTVSADNNGEPLILSQGRLLNVLIDLLGTTQKVLICVHKWGDVDIYQEF